jgi:hypothetical protein
MKKLFLIVLLVWGSNYVFAQKTSGAAQICLNCEHEYYISTLPSDCYSNTKITRTHITGGTVVSQDGDYSVYVRWTQPNGSIYFEGTGTYGCGTDPTSNNRSFITNTMYVNAVSSLSSDNAFTFRMVKQDRMLGNIMLSNVLSRTDSITITANDIHILDPYKDDDGVYYQFKCSFDNGLTYRSFRSTESNTITFHPSEISGCTTAETIKFAVDADTRRFCPIVGGESRNYELKYFFDDLTDSVTPPTCNGFGNTEIQLTGFNTELDTCDIYAFTDLTQRDFYDITITRFEKTTDVSCAGGVDPVIFPDITGEYCPSGFVYNYAHEAIDSTLILNGDSIVIYKLENPHEVCDTVWKGPRLYTIECFEVYDTAGSITSLLHAGIYTIDTEHPMYYQKQFVSKVDEPTRLNFENASPIENYGEFHVAAPDSSNGSFEIQVKGGTPPWEAFYEYGSELDSKIIGTPFIDTSVIFLDTITRLHAGEYSIYIRDSNDCLDMAVDEERIISNTLLSPDALRIDTTVINHLTCNKLDSAFAKNGALNYIIQGGISPYYVEILDENKNVINFDDVDIDNYYDDSYVQSLFAFDTLNAGNYYLTIRDNDDSNEGYSSNPAYQKDTSLQFVIHQPKLLQIVSFDTISPTCLNGKDGRISLNALGERDNYTFKRTDNNQGIDSILAIYSGLSNEEYIFKLIDVDNDCYTVDTVNIPENPKPVELNISEPFKSECKDSLMGEIKVSAINGSQLDNSFYLIPGNIVNFDMGKVKQTIQGNDSFFTELKAGDYSVFVQDENKCLDSSYNHEKYRDLVSVQENPLIRKTSLTAKDIADFGDATGEFKIEVEGGAGKYIWKLTDSLDNIIKQEITNGIFKMTDLLANKYTISIEDTCNCINPSNHQTILEITQPSKPLQLFLDSTIDPKCYGESSGLIKVYATDGWGNYTYHLLNETDTLHSNIDGAFDNLPIASYKIVVNDFMGAFRTMDVSLNQPEELKVNDTSIKKVGCYGGANGEVLLDIFGGSYPYYYSTDNWTTEQEGILVDELSAGIHEILIRDANYCMQSVISTVDQYPELKVDSVKIIGAICGVANGALNAYISGGVEPYIYQWTNELDQVVSTNENAVHLLSGNYSLQIIDSLGCNVANNNIIVTNSGINSHEIIISEEFPISCFGYSDGKTYYQFYKNEGQAPFTLELFHENENTPILIKENASPGIDSLINLAGGSYQIKITDNKGCIAANTFNIGSPLSLKIVLEELNQPTCFGYNDASISVDASGGNGAYKYLWSDGSENYEIKDMKPGVYEITVTDSKECALTDQFKIVEPELLVVDLGADIAICDGQEYYFWTDVFESYQWTFNGEDAVANRSIRIDEQGSYAVTVTDQNGCIASDDVFIEIRNDLLEADFLMPSDAYTNDTVVVIDVSWPEPEYVFWDFDEGVESINSQPYSEELVFNEEGTYRVSLISEKGTCFDSISKYINIKVLEQELERKLKLGANPSLISSFAVYPNPSTGQFSVKLELREESDIEISLLKMENQILLNKQKSKGFDVYEFDYNLGRIQSGVYILQLKVGNELKTKKMLIIK